MSNQVLKERNLFVKFQHLRLPANFKLPSKEYRQYDFIKQKARQIHHYKRDCHGNPKISSRGGITIANIFDKDNNIVVTAEACCLLSDNYNKQEGRNYSLERAIVQLERVEND